jgi:hypothetical protein
MTHDISAISMISSVEGNLNAQLDDCASVVSTIRRDKTPTIIFYTSLYFLSRSIDLSSSAI